MRVVSKKPFFLFLLNHTLFLVIQSHPDDASLLLLSRRSIGSSSAPARLTACGQAGAAGSGGRPVGRRTRR